MNLNAAKQAANSIDVAIRLGGAQAALAHLDLLNAIAQAVADHEAEAAEDAKAAQNAEPKQEEKNA